MAVPYLDLKDQHKMLKADILADVEKILDSAWFVGGKFIEALENEFAAKSDSKYSIAVASGTMACKLAYAAVGLKEGDEILTTPNTFFATCEAAHQMGATVKFVDVDPDTFVMDPKVLEAAITEKTKLIVPVHLYGVPCDMDAILQIARKHNLKVVEDTCQSHFATYKGKKLGSFGDAAAFSFYPSKNLGACGDAGIITTSSDEVVEMARTLRNHGQTGRYVHSYFGDNGRMDEIQAAIVVRKLKHIDAWTEQRQAVAARYIERLGHLKGLKFQKVPEGCTHVYYMFAVTHPERDKIAKEFADNQIGFAFQGVTPLHLQDVYAGQYKVGDLPVVENVMNTMLSFPVFPEMTMEMVDEVCDAVIRAIG